VSANALLSELDHRVKNILSIVTSVVTQTLKRNRDPDVFGAAIQGRIAAIARAHSTLTEQGGQSDASFRDLVTTELAPYAEGRTITIDGADLLLTPKAGLSLALAVHELASNAAKYGSLSVAGGQLAVSWALGDAHERVLRFVWAETGGPRIEAPPTQRGFGTTLIERALTYEFDAVVDRAFLPNGLRCTIDLPLTTDIGELRPSSFPAGNGQ
jgi:two-component system CheB/CheR fusion protein